MYTADTADIRRQIKWKREAIEGELERQGRHILHVRETYLPNSGELLSLNFYCTDVFSAVDKIQYNGRGKLLSESHVSEPRASSYALSSLATNAVPLAAYFVARKIGLDMLGSMGVSALVLLRARRFMAELEESFVNDNMAWNAYGKYAASLEPIPEPEELKIL